MVKKSNLLFLIGNIVLASFYGIGYCSFLLVSKHLSHLQSDLGSPGLDFLIIAFLILGAVFWTVLSSYKVIVEKRNFFFRGVFVMNIIIISVFIAICLIA